MIDLTPLDVRKKKEDFKRAVRGYDPAQVDTFLELVADRLEQLVREHSNLTQRVESLREQLSTYQERERALNEALLAAQELREEARSQAERDAAVRLREAETHAEAILLDADQAIRHSQRRLEDLRARRTQFLRSLGSLLDRFQEYVELERTRLETEPEDLGTLLEKLEGDIGAVDDAADDAETDRPGATPATGSGRGPESDRAARAGGSDGGGAETGSSGDGQPVSGDDRAGERSTGPPRDSSPIGAPAPATSGGEASRPDRDAG